jgi:hypothetical protein
MTMADVRNVIRTRSPQSISYEHNVLSMVVTNFLYHSVVSIVTITGYVPTVKADDITLFFSNFLQFYSSCAFHTKG